MNFLEKKNMMIFIFFFILNQLDVTTQENALNACGKDDMHVLSGEEDPWVSQMIFF